MLKRCLAVLFIFGMLLSTSGCSFFNLDMEKQLRAPHAGGDYTAIQEALEKHIYSVKADLAQGIPTPYVLKYPRMGDYRSAFIMKDINGDGEDEVLAFYAMQPDGANSHVALLRKVGGVWECTDDIEGLATEIERIQFADFDGNGTIEVLAGYTMYNTRDRRLMVYEWKENALTECYNDTYTHMLVGELTSSLHDDLLLFRMNSAEAKTTVKLVSIQNSEAVTKGEVSLDGYITSFQEHQFVDFGNRARGVYLECAKEANTMVTELVVWDGSTLSAPLYDPRENITSCSARESGLPFKDIDDDDEIEWPASFRFPGDEEKPIEEISLWLTKWQTWDPLENRVETKQIAIVNDHDGYQLEIPENWANRLSASYDAEERKMTVYQVKNGVVGKELFHIVAFSALEENPFGDNYLFLDVEEKTRYEMKVATSNESDLTAEKLRALFSIYE